MQALGAATLEVLISHSNILVSLHELFAELSQFRTSQYSTLVHLERVPIRDGDDDKIECHDPFPLCSEKRSQIRPGNGRMPPFKWESSTSCESQEQRWQVCFLEFMTHQKRPSRCISKINPARHPIQGSGVIRQSGRDLVSLCMQLRIFGG